MVRIEVSTTSTDEKYIQQDDNLEKVIKQISKVSKDSDKKSIEYYVLEFSEKLVESGIEVNTVFPHEKLLIYVQKRFGSKAIDNQLSKAMDNYRINDLDDKGVFNRYHDKRNKLFFKLVDLKEIKSVYKRIQSKKELIKPVDPYDQGIFLINYFIELFDSQFNSEKVYQSIANTINRKKLHVQKMFSDFGYFNEQIIDDKINVQFVLIQSIINYLEKASESEQGKLRNRYQITMKRKFGELKELFSYNPNSHQIEGNLIYYEPKENFAFIYKVTSRRTYGSIDIILVPSEKPVHNIVYRGR